MDVVIFLKSPLWLLLSLRRAPDENLDHWIGWWRRFGGHRLGAHGSSTFNFTSLRFLREGLRRLLSDAHCRSVVYFELCGVLLLKVFGTYVSGLG